MKTLRNVNIESRLYFFNSMTNIKNFFSGLLKKIKYYFKTNIDCVIYFIECFKNFDSKNSLYLVFNNVDAYIEESNGNKYLIFASTDKEKRSIRKLHKTFGRN